MQLNGVSSAWTINATNVFYPYLSNIIIYTNGNGILFKTVSTYNFGNWGEGNIQIWLQGNSGIGLDLNGTSSNNENLLIFSYVGIVGGVGTNTNT
jgi:hypothetical protein